MRARASLPGRQDGAQKLKGLDALLPGQGVSYLTPEHLLEDVELALDLTYVEARLEAVGRKFVGRGDDRVGVTLADATYDELEQVLQMLAARLCARGLGTGMALVELGDRLVHDPVLRTGKDF